MSVRVRVKNVGPISDATTVIRPLTILVGTNNTGKTFFATILHKVVDAATYSRATYRGRGRRLPEPPLELSLLWGRRFDGQEELPLKDKGEYGQEAKTWAANYVKQALDEYASGVLASIEYAFGVEAVELRRKTSSGRRSPGSWVEVTDLESRWTIRVHLDGSETEVSPPDPVQWLDRLVEQSGPKSNRDWELMDRLQGFYPAAPPGLFDDWPSQSIHLPAGRTGIMQSYQVLAGTVVRQSAAAGIRPIQVATLPGTSADFLSLLLSLSGSPAPVRRRRKSSKSISDMVDELEENNRVKIVVDDVPGEAMASVFAVTPEGRFPLARTSSMVSELAPILLTLRHVVSPGDQLVIDEPEAHLHPAMQRTIAAFFAQLSRHNVWLIITTHSDFLVGEINNLIRASGVKSSEGKQGVLELGTPVTSEAVGALRFERGRSGCHAEELRVDPFDGIDESTFADVIEALYDESLALSELRRSRD